MDVLIGQKAIAFSEELKIRLADIQGKNLLDFLIYKKMNEFMIFVLDGGKLFR